MVVIAAIGVASSRMNVDPLLGKCGVDRHIGGPGFQHGQDGHDRVRAERGISSATYRPGPAPWSVSRWANRLAAASSSR